MINYNSILVYKDNDEKDKNKEILAFIQKNLFHFLLYFYPVKNFNIDINQNFKLNEKFENVSSEKFITNDGELENQDLKNINEN